MLGITDYLWRLIPANPILLRVVESGGKRRRDLFIRCIYLGILVFYVTFSLLSGSGDAGPDLAKLASASASIFQKMSYLQLALVALIAPIFTAGAITQEKDSQTYDILLSTPLTNGQIVLGSLLSRLFFVIALLISGIPVFAVTQIFGGVAVSAIVTSFAIAAATAFVTGALAMAIATLKVGTRRTIFSFYLFIVIYLVGGLLLDQLSFLKIHLIDPATGQTADELSKTTWLTGIHPFLALRSILFDRDYLPPDLTELPGHLRYWPIGWYLSNPAGFFISFMFSLSFLLVIPSIILLRRLAQSTVTMRGWILQTLRLSTGDRTRKPRSVWSNPIAWREAKTKASAARAAFLRYGVIGAGLAGAVVLCVMYSMKQPVNRYVDQTSFDSAGPTLTVYTDNQAKTYRVWNNTLISIADRPASFDQISRKYQVLDSDLNLTPDGKNVAQIKLRPIPRRLDAADARQFVLGAVIVEFAVILLIVTNAAASTVTREKEDGTLDLLLSTPITSRYYIWGKLRGLVSYVLPLVAVPAISAALFIVYDFLSLAGGSADANFRWIVLPEAIFILPASFTIVAAFAAILGMQMSLRCRTTVMAVMSSVGIVVGICGTLGWCGYKMLDSSSSSASAIVAAFSPFTVLTLLIDPQHSAARIFDSDSFEQARMFMWIFSVISLAAYTGVVWAMYMSMVKNFDMTIRRQSR